MELAPLCNHPDLKKDAAFGDDFAKFIKTHNTSDKFLTHFTAIIKQYLTARRQVNNQSVPNELIEESDIETNAFNIFNEQWLIF